MRAWSILLVVLLGVLRTQGVWAQPPDTNGEREEEPKRDAVGDKSEEEPKDDADAEGDDEEESETEEPDADDKAELSVAEQRAEDKKKEGVVKLAEKSDAVTDVTKEDAAASLAEPSTVTLADAEVEVPEGFTLPKRLGPVRLTIGDTKDWVGFGFAAQLEFEHDQLFEGAGQEQRSSDTIEFRRIRTYLTSSFLDGRIRSQFQLNLSPQNLELIDLWLAFTRFRYATIRIGQFKIPFTRYRAQSFAALSFVDWSPVTRMFGAERQLGVELLAIGTRLQIEYAAGIFTGVNARASHAVGLPEIYGLVPENPSELGSGSIFNEVHPALVGRVAKNFGKINTDTNSDVVGGPLRQSVGVSIAGDFRAEATINLPIRVAVEWLAKVEHLDVNIVGYLGWFERWTNGDLGFGTVGLLVETGYRFTNIWELAARYSLTYITDALQNDAAAFAQNEIENATDPMEAANQFAGVGELIAQHQVAVAVSAHIIGNSLKAVLETDWEGQKVDQGRQNTLVVTLMLQFVF